MPRLQMGPWTPDAPALGNTGLVDVSNAVPGKDFWLPQRRPIKVSDQSIDPPIQGVWTGNRTFGDQVAFVAFDGRIYLVDGFDNPLTGISRVGGYDQTVNVRWRTVQNANLLIATNYSDEIQAFDLTAGGGYDDLSPDAPKARYLAQVRDFTVVGNTVDPIDGVQVYRIWWHGFTNGLPNPRNWVDGQSDFATINDIGQVQGLTGGQFGTAVCEHGIAIIRFGGRLLFQVEVVERQLGTRVPNSVVQYRQVTFFYSPEGWVSFDGNAAKKIGLERIDRWFEADFDSATADKMWAAVDDLGHLVWIYCGRDHTGTPNRLLRYAPELDQWAKSDLLLDALGSGQTFGRSLDDPSFVNFEDTITNMDDPGLWLDIPRTVCVAARRLSGFTGSQLEAGFTLGEFQFGGDRSRAMLREILFLGKSGTTRLQVATRQQFQDAETFGPTFGAESDGWFRPRIPARTHQIRILRTGSWINSQGVDVFAEPLGR